MISSEALLCVKLCAMARNTEAVRHIVLSDKGLTHEWFENKGTSAEGFVCSDKETVYLIFKSTDGLRDWFTDISSWYKFNEDLNDTVHYGFDTAYESVEKSVRKLVTKHGVANKRFVIAGHSLGGALTQIASSNLLPDYFYTFGSPRAFSVNSSKRFNDMQISGERYVVAGDFITRVPNPVFFRHVGKLFYFNLNGQLKMQTTAWKRYADSVKDIFNEIVTLSIFKFEDHEITLYEKYMKDNHGNNS